MASNHVYRALESSKSERSIVGIHMDPDNADSFELGWIVDLTESHFLLATIDEVGRQDSMIVGIVREILRISVDSPYIRGVARLSLSHLPESETVRIGASFESVLDYSAKTKRVVSFFDRAGTKTHGQVIEFDEESVRIRLRDKVGNDLGEEVFYRDSFFAMEFAGQRERAIETAMDTG